MGRSRRTRADFVGVAYWLYVVGTGKVSWVWLKSKNPQGFTLLVYTERFDRVVFNVLLAGRHITMSGPRLDNAAAHELLEEEEQEDEDEAVSDNPLPAWMEGDSLAPPCQADMEVVRAIIDFAGVTQDDVSLCSASDHTYSVCHNRVVGMITVVSLFVAVPVVTDKLYFVPW